jgi:lysophospholipase L1-like esterase
VIYILPRFATGFPYVDRILPYERAVHKHLDRRVYFLPQVPLRADNPENSSPYFIDDGIHPNPKGAKVIADDLYEVLTR